MNMTEKRYEALSALLPESRYLLRRDSTLMVRADRLICLTGTHIIELVGHREKAILKISGQTAAGLEKEGAITKVADRAAHGELFQITAVGKKILADFQELLASGVAAPWDKPTRVTERMVASMATRHSCILKFNVARKWYELERRDGRELLMPTIFHPKTKRPARKFSSLTPAEWSAAVQTAALLKEPIDDDSNQPGSN